MPDAEGTIPLQITAPPEFTERFKAFCESRGNTIRDELEDALTTYLGGRPVAVLDAAPPKSPPTDPSVKGRRTVQRRWPVDAELYDEVRERTEITLRALSDEVRFILEWWMTKHAEDKKGGAK